jgi:hypothetical protein
MFDPTVGRWISQDPLGLEPDVNPYRYVHNGFPNATDPSGLDPFGVTIDPSSGKITPTDSFGKPLYPTYPTTTGTPAPSQAEQPAARSTGVDLSRFKKADYWGLKRAVAEAAGNKYSPHQWAAYVDYYLARPAPVLGPPRAGGGAAPAMAAQGPAMRGRQDPLSADREEEFRLAWVDLLKQKLQTVKDKLAADESRARANAFPTPSNPSASRSPRKSWIEMQWEVEEERRRADEAIAKMDPDKKWELAKELAKLTLNDARLQVVEAATSPKAIRDAAIGGGVAIGAEAIGAGPLAGIAGGFLLGWEIGDITSDLWYFAPKWAKEAKTVDELCQAAGLYAVAQARVEVEGGMLLASFLGGAAGKAIIEKNFGRAFLKAGIELNKDDGGSLRIPGDTPARPRVGVMPSADSNTRPPRLSVNWKARTVTDPACQTGCENVARQIQGHIGGDIRRITPTDPNANFLGPYRGHNPAWAYHEVVVKEGRVYDAFTGHEGLPIAEYKALWEYGDAIKFGF